MATESGSGFKNMHFWSFLFTLEANKSICGLPNLFTIKEDALSDSTHSVESSNCLDICQPECYFCQVCELLTYILWGIVHSHISFKGTVLDILQGASSLGVTFTRKTLAWYDK